MSRQTRRSARRKRRLPAKLLALAGIAGLAATGLLASAPAYADSLTNMSFTVSNNATSSPSTSVPANTYTWSFTPASPTTLGSVTLTVPSGTSVAKNITATIYGLPNCSGATAALTDGTGETDPDTVTVTLPAAGCAPITNVPITITVAGLTNTATSSPSFETEVTTHSTVDPSTVVDQSTINTGTAFTQNSTQVTVVIPDSLTFSNATTNLAMMAVPGGDPVNANPVNLTVKTNAAGGYTLNACVPEDTKKKGDFSNGALTSMSDTSIGIPQLATTATTLDHTSSASAFGAIASITQGKVKTGSASLGSNWSSTNAKHKKYVGYAASCASGTSGAEVAADTGITDGDDISLTNGVYASDTQAAGVYTGTIWYQVTPSY